ncbi:MAG TPA: hypothetical protein VKW78_09725 [Terriglobales bacterium]|nr:hypothetical protein [Terriglobales bacterium]
MSIRKRQISGENHGGFLGWFGNDLEQELGTYFGQRHVTLHECAAR